mgnify:FL=1
MKSGIYNSDHYYWDEMEREYTLEATWLYENNGNDEPSLWYLLEIEIVEQERGSPEINVATGSDVWHHILRDPDESRMEQRYVH